MAINKPSVFIGENNQDQLYFTQAKTGINTTDPTEKLEVAGNVKANFFIGLNFDYFCLDSGSFN